MSNGDGYEDIGRAAWRRVVRPVASQNRNPRGPEAAGAAMDQRSLYLANTSLAVCDFTRAAAFACTTPLRTALSFAAT